MEPDQATIREDAARAKELCVIINAAKKAEDRRDKLMSKAKTRTERNVLEKRFQHERRVDAQRIKDLSQEREDMMRVSIARNQPQTSSHGSGKTLTFAPTHRDAKERTMTGSNNLELQFFKDIYGKLDKAQPRRVPNGGGRHAASRQPTTDRSSSHLLEKRDLLMRLQSLVVQEHELIGAPSNRSSAYTQRYSSMTRPGSARSLASRSSIASAATVGYKAGAPPPRPLRVPKLRL